ncbi:MAG: chromosomal replication initiator protein DnaA [Patescibacteria group bacterium]|nr:chromosomal replication initiator protein DnaA [Patescibacteria group bacterium]
MTNEELWKTILGEMELCISKASFTTWFRGTGILSRSENEIIISVPNGFAKEWLENKYHKFILRAIQSLYPKITKVIYKIGGTLKQSKQIKRIEDITNTQTAVNIKAPANTEDRSLNELLNCKYNFNSFVVGSNNELAFAACQAVTKNPGTVYNPLFIYGGVGLGKTHLLQSIGNEVLKNDSNKKIKYASSEKFTNELIEAIAGKNTKLFKDIYRNIDILIIDDIQFLAGKEKTQEEFFHTFNTLYDNNKQIVLSSDRPPKAIPEIEDRLRSRFEGGMIADIGFPSYEMRLAILKSKLSEKDFEMPDESLNYIALHIQKNIRELEGALNRVIAICDLEKKYPSLKKTTNILADLISPPIKKATTSKDILKNVAEFYGISLEDIISKNRRKEVVKPRQIAMYLMRNENKSSFPSIGMATGGRDHTTAMHAYEKISKEIEDDKTLEQETHLITEKIYNANLVK